MGGMSGIDLVFQCAELIFHAMSLFMSYECYFLVFYVIFLKPHRAALNEEVRI